MSSMCYMFSLGSAFYHHYTSQPFHQLFLIPITRSCPHPGWGLSELKLNISAELDSV